MPPGYIHILDDSGAALCGEDEGVMLRTPNGSPLPGIGPCGDCSSIAMAAQMAGKRAETVRRYTPPPPRTPRHSYQRPVGPKSGGTTEPKVSFITCSYNRPDLLRECVASLLAQTDSRWEQLICDDASTDPAVEEVLAWAEEDPRIRVWRRSENIDAPSVLWNFMLDRAHGKYFSILDDDNEKLPQFVEVMAGYLDEHPDVGLVTCGVVSVDHTGRRSATSPNMRTTIEEVDRENTCDGGAMLYRRELLDRIGTFTESQRTGEDWDLFRRALRATTVHHLPECYATYRAHSANRMIRRHALGMDSDTALMLSRVFSTEPLRVQIYGPPAALRTPSQRDALDSIERAIQSVPWLSIGDGGLGLIVMPFQVDTSAISIIAQKHKRLLFVMLEDPSAIRSNLMRVRAAISAQSASLDSEVWVCTNDAAVVDEYRALVADRVIVCPFLGTDSTLGPVINPTAARDIDVLFCGYAYPSRKRLLDEVIHGLKGKRVLIIGDGWGSYSKIKSDGPVEILRTQSLSVTYAYHFRAKTVICAQRKYEDLFNGSVYQPETVNRGFMEGFFSPRVFIDAARSKHPFDPEDVVFYESPQELIESINLYLALLDYNSEGLDYYAKQFTRKCQLLYTYRARIIRVLNCLQSPRFLAEIP